MTRAPHTLARGISSSAVYGVLSIAAGLTLLPLVVGTVGAGPYGSWLLLSALATYLYQLDLGIGAALVHFLAKARANGTAEPGLTATGTFWMFAVGLAAVIPYLLVSLVLMGGAARRAGVSASDFHTLVMLGAALCALIGVRVFPSILEGHGYWIYQRGGLMAGLAVRIIGTVAVCLAAPSIVGIAAVEATALVLPSVLAGWRAHRLNLLSLRASDVTRKALRELLGYSVKSFLVGAMAAILLQADALIVGAVVGVASVTYYTAAFRIYMAARQVLGWFTDPLLPALSRQFEADRVAALETFRGLQFLILWAAALLAGTISIAGPGFIPAWLGANAPTGSVAIAVAILLGSLVPNAGHLAAIPATSAMGEPGAFLKLHALWCGTNVALSVWLGTRWGIEGVALGTALPLLLLEPLYLRETARRLGLSPRAWSMSCLLPVAGIAGFAALCAALAFAAGGALADGDFAWICAAASYAAGFVWASWARRAAIPIVELRAVAGTSL